MQGDLDAAGRLLELVPLDTRDPSIFGTRVEQLIFTGRPAEAIEVLESTLRTPGLVPDVVVPSYRSWIGVIYITSLQNKSAAMEHLLAGRAGFEAIRNSGRENTWTTSGLAEVCGYLGDKACVEAEVARMQDVINNDANEGPIFAKLEAVARAWLGETDAALELVTRLLRIPGGGLTPALLRVDPIWKPLRNDPRFHKLAETKP